MRRGSRLLPALALLAACDGGAPFDPCSLDLACNAAGIDIAILSVTPRWASHQDFDAGVGTRVVQPGDAIAVDVVVMNRGTIDATHPAELVGRARDTHHELIETVRVAPLDVGERATIRVTFELADGPRFRRWPEAIGAAVESFRLVHDGYEDADSANDARGGFGFHVDAPVLELRLSGLPDTMLVQTTYGATLTVRNHSERRAFAGGLEVEFCALHLPLDLYCERGVTDAVSPATVGAVPAGGTRAQPVSIRLSRDALLRFDIASDVFVAACVERTPDERDCLPPADFDPSTDQAVVALPSLITDCDAPALADESLLVLADALCVHRLGSGDVVYAVAWFTAGAGECWRIDFVSASSGNVILRDAASLSLLEHEPVLDCFRVERTGAQLVIVRPATPGGTPSGTLRLRRIQ